MPQAAAHLSTLVHSVFPRMFPALVVNHVVKMSGDNAIVLFRRAGLNGTDLAEPRLEMAS
ncbi:hypothetical protein NITLEN_20709 [Nitrospira lenta]|uniref:Uncharacterized protein n=1 Tax=Nitrospira lenta TaxID=1436998 RepID=A0A330LDR3_9BACT|nr:hypothetical protein NITLEN_20709 [Nitrospira lenta]